MGTQKIIMGEIFSAKFIKIFFRNFSKIIKSRSDFINFLENFLKKIFYKFFGKNSRVFCFLGAHIPCFLFLPPLRENFSNKMKNFICEAKIKFFLLWFEKFFNSEIEGRDFVKIVVLTNVFNRKLFSRFFCAHFVFYEIKNENAVDQALLFSFPF